MKPQFPYETKWNEVEDLQILSLKSLDDTIDVYFKEYERSQEEWLFDLCPYFGVIWPASLALTKYLKENFLPRKEKTVLELGCGLAIPSLYLAKKGFSVTATDFHPDVPFFLFENQRKNQVEIQFRVSRWRDLRINAELLIGSDILYDKNQVDELLQLLERTQWEMTIISDPGRPYWDRFIEEAKKRFVVREFLYQNCFFCELKR
jgi:predicted nicotinamide N-methyase